MCMSRRSCVEIPFIKRSTPLTTCLQNAAAVEHAFHASHLLASHLVASHRSTSHLLTSRFSLLASHFSLVTSCFLLLASRFSLLTSHFSLLAATSSLGVRPAYTGLWTLNGPRLPSRYIYTLAIFNNHHFHPRHLQPPSCPIIPNPYQSRLSSTPTSSTLSSPKQNAPPSSSAPPLTTSALPSTSGSSPIVDPQVAFAQDHRNKRPLQQTNQQNMTDTCRSPRVSEKRNDPAVLADSDARGDTDRSRSTTTTWPTPQARTCTSAQWGSTSPSRPPTSRCWPSAPWTGVTKPVQSASSESCLHRGRISGWLTQAHGEPQNHALPARRSASLAQSDVYASMPPEIPSTWRAARAEWRSARAIYSTTWASPL